MVYPIVVVSIATLILTGIMVFIIPKFEAIFTDFGVALPWLTRWLMRTSRWFAGTMIGQGIPGYLIALPFPVLAYIFWTLIRKAGPGRAATDYMILYSPVFGNLVRKTVIARFTRTLGTLISAGVPILEANKITKETSGNYVFEKALQKVHDSIREGEGFAAPLRESKTCDAIVVNMIDVGEETGELDAMLMKIANIAIFMSIASARPARRRSMMVMSRCRSRRACPGREDGRPVCWRASNSLGAFPW